MQIYKNLRSTINRTFPFSLLPLPYRRDAFEKDFCSEEVFQYHVDKHHLTYCMKLNSLLEEDKYHDLKQLSLESLISQSLKKDLTLVFNNAAQLWNHDFLWFCITPDNKQNRENYDIFQKIALQYGSWEKFATLFIEKSLAQFGSGWSWLTLRENTLSIETTSNATTPIAQNAFPIFTCDLWEHAYYLIFKNNRKEYVEKFLQHLNWQQLEQNYLYLKNLSHHK
ncbi:superoxide dismutase [Candidatus Sneabacter namystus]|uniref:Superoxide dismutase n=1 Tax=Candidatus Sneabacter namystus TaxID=2601646 RepID=A0A5C0UIB9_9RICK|nr:superoxide dismutase [Candidatus Sneabacter namystus]QEK39529.1 superoxide dismutase [Candidatus Sneabacter namystus]